MEGMTQQEINLILNTAESFREVSDRNIKKVPTLRGRTIINFFHEPSTRTRISFEIAAKRMSADGINFSKSGSSFSKGETLLDTVRNLEAMQADLIVIRHSVPGAPKLIAEHLDAAVINAGDGPHEHPTQALLDMFTMRQHRGDIKGKTVLIIGDIAFSRVARSNIYGLLTMGAKIILAGPPTLIPAEIQRLGVKISYNLDDVIPEADIIMILRIQLERQGRTYLPSLREYAKLFSVTPTRLKRAKHDVLIMHPGPINRGVELDSRVADGKLSVILDQVSNGVAIRMALLFLLAGRKEMNRNQ
ncbi:aspartate carbamoyltransferase catalytic subunit [bacterium]|nr:aspartate carbamoyltransferase catalytic subunit [bacterium]